MSDRRNNPTPRTRADGTPFVERRRKGPDPITRIIQISTIFAWITSLVVLTLLVSARPADNQNMFTRILDLKVAPTGWDFVQLRVAFFLIIFTVLICAAGIVGNAMRHKRKTDRFRVSLFVFLGISLVALIAFIIVFGVPF